MAALARSTPALALSLLAAACGASVASGPGGTGGSGGGAGVCAAQVADATAAPVTVRLVNKTAGDLYVAISDYESCTETPLYSASVADPSLDANPPTGNACGGSTCATNTCSSCVVTYTCSTRSPVTRVASGGALTTSWSGLVYQTRSVPSACVADPTCYGGTATVSCPVALRNESWPVTFTASMSTGVTCASGACTCSPDATGTCVVSVGDGSSPSSATVQGTATLEEGGTSVDIVFQ
jgi:hypothetical protein